MSYTAAVVTAKYQEADGRLRLDVTYTGNAGEPPVILPLYVSSTSLPTADEFRTQAITRLSILNNTKSVFDSIAVPLLLDTTTPLPIPPTGVVTRSYMAAAGPFTPGTTPQDVFTITGSATKTVTVLRMGLTTTQTTAGNNSWYLVKRSTSNTGGTSALVTAVPTDKSFAAETATVRQYTANPTAGALVGRVWCGRIASPAPATVIQDTEKYVVPFDSAPIVLSGNTDVLAWNFNGAALPAGLSVFAYAWWTER